MVSSSKDSSKGFLLTRSAHLVRDSFYDIVVPVVPFPPPAPPATLACVIHPHLLLPLFCILALPLSAQRLSPDVRPSHYTLGLDVDIAGRRFSGEGTIDLTTASATSAIALNSLGLTIERAAIDGVAASVTAGAGDEQITLAVPGPLAAGEHRIALVWSGGLSDTDLRGLYLSKSARRAYAVTQFEGTYARMMFPSFDEPGFKATFDLSVVVDAGDTAISNAAILRDEEVGDGRHRIAFATSPKMSTYLVALAVGDFACSSGTEAGVPLRVCSVPEKVEETRSPLEAARAAVRFYQQWFSIRYPFGKLDLVAIPDYESFGRDEAVAGRPRGARDRASVVRRSGHGGVVG
jgi:aminopeptidase N/puromycin-sensitive aminopeptidase